MMNLYLITDDTYGSILSVFSYPDDASARRAFDAAAKGSEYPVSLRRLCSISNYHEFIDSSELVFTAIDDEGCANFTIKPEYIANFKPYKKEVKDE